MKGGVDGAKGQNYEIHLEDIDSNNGETKRVEGGMTLQGEGA